MAFIHEDFLLQNQAAKRLYHDFAEMLPIIDYHCHLSPEAIAEDIRFDNITALMLSGDHYKWRAMRSAGVEEPFITGKDTSPWEKFQKWAEVVPLLIGNPLYHWTHLELSRYFGIEDCLSPDTAEEIFSRCNQSLEEPGYSARGLIKSSNVVALCTTDDPMDNLAAHEKLREDFPVLVLPTFRPDKVFAIEKEGFSDYVLSLGVSSFRGLLGKLKERMDFFASRGCRLSDHSLERLFYQEGDPEPVFQKAMAGEPLSRKEADIFKTALLVFCGKTYHDLGWVMQLHIGALRNNNSRMFEALGADSGFDSINDDGAVAEPLSRLLDAMDGEGRLPKTILYSLHPKDNYVLGTMLGNFQSAPHFGKIQLGSGWWFNDQKDGMEAQLRALGNLGVLPSFVGMLTDSRSFLSYPRHEYFRRILCNLLGTWVEQGLYPADWGRLGDFVRGICYENAKQYFDL